MLPRVESCRPMNASRLGMYFHLPRMPVPKSPLGRASTGVFCRTMVQPSGDAVAGGVSTHTRPSPHHSAKRLRLASKSKPQLDSVTLPLASSVGNSPLGSVGVTRTSRLPDPGVLRSQYTNGTAALPVRTNSLRSGSTPHE